MDQTILACDDDGKVLEYIPKAAGHTGEGRRHLAITVLLYNNQRQVLLQRRKHQVFDNIWDFTASTHPLHTADGDESLEEATLRALKDEYGIEDVKLREVGSFNYFAKIDGMCENEHCAILIGEYNGPLNLNPEVGYEYKWMNTEDFLTDIQKTPQKYTPWAVKAVKIIKRRRFLTKSYNLLY